MVRYVWLFSRFLALLHHLPGHITTFPSPHHQRLRLILFLSSLGKWAIKANLFPLRNDFLLIENHWNFQSVLTCLSLQYICVEMYKKKESDPAIIHGRKQKREMLKLCRVKQGFALLLLYLRLSNFFYAMRSYSLTTDSRFFPSFFSIGEKKGWEVNHFPLSAREWEWGKNWVRKKVGKDAYGEKEGGYVRDVEMRVMECERRFKSFPTQV